MTFMNAPARETPISDIGSKIFPYIRRTTGITSCAQSRIDCNTLSCAKLPEAMLSISCSGCMRVDVEFDLLDAFFRSAPHRHHVRPFGGDRGLGSFHCA